TTASRKWLPTNPVAPVNRILGPKAPFATFTAHSPFASLVIHLKPVNDVIDVLIRRKHRIKALDDHPLLQDQGHPLQQRCLVYLKRRQPQGRRQMQLAVAE